MVDQIMTTSKNVVRARIEIIAEDKMIDVEHILGAN